MHADRPGQPVGLAPHYDARCVAVSRDGKMVATCGDNPVSVWHSERGKPPKQLPTVRRSVALSSDGKWRGARAADPRLWEVSSRNEGPKIGGAPAPAAGRARRGGCAARSRPRLTAG